MANKIATPTKKSFRKRIIREDDILNNRTSIFLISNGLFLTSISLLREENISIIITILGLLVSIAWMLSSWQSWKVIKNLTKEYLKIDSKSDIEIIVQNSLFKAGWRRPTELLAKSLPTIFILVWCVLSIIFAFYQL